MHLDKHSDRVTALARSMAERLAPFCEHVPPEELAELTTRLATSEITREGAPRLVADEAPAVGNQVVWLRGPSGAAIVLPAGEPDPAPVPSMAELVDLARQHAGRAAEHAARSYAVVRERATALLDAWQSRLRTELPER